MLLKIATVSLDKGTFRCAEGARAFFLVVVPKDTTFKVLRYFSCFVVTRVVQNPLRISESLLIGSQHEQTLSAVHLVGG